MRAVSKVPDRTFETRPPRRWGLRTVVALVGVGFAFPVGYLAWAAVGLGGEFWATLTSASTLVPLRNSLLIAGSTAATAGLLGSLLAWLVVRTDLPGRRLWKTILPLPLVVPSFVGATALLAAFGRGGLVPFIPRVEGFWGAFAVLTLLTYPYVYLPVAARLSTTSASLEEAARLLGKGSVTTIVRVVVPQIRETVLAGTMLVFLYGLSDFGAVSLMRYDTITRAIFSARLFDRAASLTLGLVLAVLALAVAAFERLGAPTRTAPFATLPLRYPLGRWSVPATLFVAAVVGVGLVAPLAVFVFWVVRGSATVGVGFSGLGDSLAFLVEPTLNSAGAALAAGVMAAVVTLPVAYAAVRLRGWVPAVTSTVVNSVFALPGLVVALAVVFWAIRAPGALGGLYQTFPLLVFAYVLHFGAQAMQSSRAAIAAVPRRYDDVGRTLGVGRWRRFLTVEVPLMRPGLVAGSGLVLLSTLKELPATLLLAPIGFETLATKIWGAAEDGFFAEVGITSLVLVALSAILTWLLVLRQASVTSPPPPN